MTNPLRRTIADHRTGQPVGIYSVCSAHQLVLEAALRQAADDDSYALIEATSNQVDQFGGYTGLTPAAFRNQVMALAGRLGFPAERIVLGGDHLGPNRWRDRPAAAAMALAKTLVAEYVKAGYTKIHIDCSMSCQGDSTPPGDWLVAQRAAQLIAVAEQAASQAGVNDQLSYVIGSEVPVPGGAHETLAKLQPTTAAAAGLTIEHHQQALADLGLEVVWPRVQALVVQPAVEFDHVQVIDYNHSATAELRTVLADQPQMVFEAHSTDYQSQSHLTELVADHWAILKVGPGLTFALREGLVGLAEIERWLVPPARRSGLLGMIEQTMLVQTAYWQGYYPGTAAQQRLGRLFSYSDRIRYYWPDPGIEATVNQMTANLEKSGIPETLLSQYLPSQYWRLRQGHLTPTVQALLIDKVRDALRPYAAACRTSSTRLEAFENA